MIAERVRILAGIRLQQDNRNTGTDDRTKATESRSDGTNNRGKSLNVQEAGGSLRKFPPTARSDEEAVVDTLVDMLAVGADGDTDGRSSDVRARSRTRTSTHTQMPARAKQGNRPTLARAQTHTRTRARCPLQHCTSFAHAVCHACS